MSRIVTAVTEKKIKEAASVLNRTASEVSKKAEEIITMNKKTLMLEIAVALLGGIVIGMFLSPRKKVTYKIASNNRINADDDKDDEDEDGNEEEPETDDEEYYEDEDDGGADEDEDEDEDEDDGDDDDDNNGKFIRL